MLDHVEPMAWASQSALTIPIDPFSCLRGGSGSFEKSSDSWGIKHIAQSKLPSLMSIYQPNEHCRGRSSVIPVTYPVDCLAGLKALETGSAVTGAIVPSAKNLLIFCSVTPPFFFPFFLLIKPCSLKESNHVGEISCFGLFWSGL